VCGGLLKPAVTFFGGNIPRPVVNESLRLVEDCDALLAAGTTMTVFSVFRLARAMHEQGKPVGVINFGDTRLHGKLAAGRDVVIPPTFHVHGDCGTVLTQALQALQLPTPAGSS